MEVLHQMLETRRIFPKSYQEAVVQRGKGRVTGQFSKMIYVRHD